MFTPFYNESLRKLVIAVGSLFNNIQVARPNSDPIRVPLAYGAKEKFIRRIEEASSISDDTQVEITLPTLGFDITSVTYDPNRHSNKLRKQIKRHSETNVSYKYNEVPYNVSFGLYSFTRTMDDNLRIMEQILPYFAPEFIVTMNMNRLNRKVDVPIVLNGVATQEEYEGDFMGRRTIITTFDLTAKSYVFNRLREGPVIKEVDVDIMGTDEKFYADTDVAYDLRLSATGSYQGATSEEGFTYGNFVYGGVTYDPE